MKNEYRIFAEKVFHIITDQLKTLDGIDIKSHTRNLFSANIGGRNIRVIINPVNEVRISGKVLNRQASTGRMAFMMSFDQFMKGIISDDIEFIGDITEDEVLQSILTGLEDVILDNIRIDEWTKVRIK